MNLKNGKRVEDLNNGIIFKYHSVDKNLYEEIRSIDIFDSYTTKDYLTRQFKILSEEDEEIDIDSIEELDYCLEELEKPSYEESWLMNCIRANKDKLNELIKAVKQLNKKIKE